MIAISSGEALGGSETPQEALQFAHAIYAGTIPTVYVICGFGLVWLVFAVAFLVDLALVQKLSFNLDWWGFMFPLGVFCTSTTQLANELHWRIQNFRNNFVSC